MQESPMFLHRFQVPPRQFREFLGKKGSVFRVGFRTSRFLPCRTVAKAWPRNLELFHRHVPPGSSVLDLDCGLGWASCSWHELARKTAC